VSADLLEDGEKIFMQEEWLPRRRVMVPSIIGLTIAWAGLHSFQDEHKKQAMNLSI